jgi:rhamnulokinase
MHISVDLGAGSGRVMLGRLDEGAFSVEEVHRFRYPPRERDGHLRWDFEAIVAGVLQGLRTAGARARTLGLAPVSVGVDSWGVDYGLVDREGRLVEEPACYRDPGRTSLMEDVLARVPRPEMFARTGIQFLPFNTAYQLYAHVREGLPARAMRLLMIPDLVHQRLCGSVKGSTRTRPPRSSSTRTPGTGTTACSSAWDFPGRSCPSSRLPATAWAS